MLTAHAQQECGIQSLPQKIEKASWYLAVRFQRGAQFAQGAQFACGAQFAARIVWGHAPP